MTGFFHPQDPWARDGGRPFFRPSLRRIWRLWFVLALLPAAAAAQEPDDEVFGIGQAEGEMIPVEQATEPVPVALEPRDVVVMANYSFPYARELAQQYMKTRSIPESQLLSTGMPQTETVSRLDYERYIAGPLKEFLVKEKLDRVRCVVLIRGVPLRVHEPEQTHEEKIMETVLRKERDRQLARLIDLAGQAQALGANDGEVTSATLPRFDPSASARRQMEGLKKNLLDAMAAAGERLRTLGPGEEHDRLEAEWFKVWAEGFGFDSPVRYKLTDLPEPDVSPERQQEFRRRITNLLGHQLYPIGVQELLEALVTARGACGTLESIELLIGRVRPDWRWRASVDSELSTVFWPPFDLAGSVRNPLKAGQAPAGAPRTMMVCRLDGPDDETVRRMIEQSAAVEKTGLHGRMYLDARGLEGNDPYARYDRSLRRLAWVLDQASTVTVRLDNTPALFVPGACPDAALYCGWYSLGRYVDAFRFVPGGRGLAYCQRRSQDSARSEVAAVVPGAA